MSAKILIIDDDASFKQVLKMRLKSFIQDVEMTTFESLNEARKLLQATDQLDFDLVILDEHLPDGRGGDLLNEGWFEDMAVLSVSSDETPELPGASLKAGAKFFLNKVHISGPLFPPLVQGIIQRNKLQRELQQSTLDNARIQTVKTLVATLRHEINNPLGAVLGAAYLMRNSDAATQEQIEAAELVESSGQRIKHVLDELCTAIKLEPVEKGQQKVFHIPGDKPWEEGEQKD